MAQSCFGAKQSTRQTWPAPGCFGGGKTDPLGGALVIHCRRQSWSVWFPRSSRDSRMRAKGVSRAAWAASTRTLYTPEHAAILVAVVHDPAARWVGPRAPMEALVKKRTRSRFVLDPVLLR